MWKSIGLLIFIQLYCTSVICSPIEYRNLKCDLQIWPKLKKDAILQQGVSHKIASMSNNTPNRPLITAGEKLEIQVFCDCCSDLPLLKRQVETMLYGNDTSNVPKGMLILRIISSNRHALIPMREPKIDRMTRTRHDSNKDLSDRDPNCTNKPKCAIMHVHIDPTETVVPSDEPIWTFYADANTLGRSTISVDFMWMNATQNEGGQPDDVPAAPFIKRRTLKKTDIKHPPKAKNLKQVLIARGRIYSPTVIGNWTALSQLSLKEWKKLAQNGGEGRVKHMWSNEMEITSLLRPRVFYKAFDWSAIGVTCMTALSVGCSTDHKHVKVKYQRPLTVLLGLIGQVIIVPAASIGISWLCNLSGALAFGLLTTAAIPGGGLAHLLVFLAEGDRHLSAAVSLVVCVTNVVTAPLWILTVGYYKFNITIVQYRLFGWLMLIALMQVFAAALRVCRPSAARAILTWVTRPLLLLSGILLITLGIYINHYVFHHVSRSMILALLLLLTFGFTLGWVIGLVSRQGQKGAKALSAETAVFNGLLSIVILRTGVHAPEGDLAAQVALWATFFTPIPWLYHAVLATGQNLFRKYVRKKSPDDEDSDSEEFGATSMAAITAASLAVTPAVAMGANRDRQGRRQSTAGQEKSNSAMVTDLDDPLGNGGTASQCLVDDKRSKSMQDSGGESKFSQGHEKEHLTKGSNV